MKSKSYAVAGKSWKLRERAANLEVEEGEYESALIVYYAELKESLASDRAFASVQSESPLVVSPKTTAITSEIEKIRLMAGKCLRRNLLDAPDLINFPESIDTLSYSQYVAYTKLFKKSKNHDESSLINGFPTGMQFLIRGYAHLFGWGVKRSIALAYTNFKSALDENDDMYEAEAKYNLSLIIIHKNFEMKQDLKKGTFFLECVASMPISHQNDNYNNGRSYGVAESKYALGKLHEHGLEGVQQSYQTAAMWYKEGHDVGHLPSTCSLAFMYKNGRGVPKNGKKAIEYFTHAADSEYPFAYIYLLHEYIQNLEIAKARRMIEFVKQIKNTFLNEIVCNIEDNFFKQGELISALSINSKASANRNRTTAKVTSAHANQVCRGIQDNYSIEIKNGNTNNPLGQRLTKPILLELCRKKLAGSTTAARIIETCILYCKLMKILKSNQKNRVSKEDLEKLLQIVDELFAKDGRNLVWKDNLLCALQSTLINYIDWIKVFITSCQSKQSMQKKLQICISQTAKLTVTESKSHEHLIQSWTIYDDVFSLSNTYAEVYLEQNLPEKAWVVAAEAIERNGGICVDLLFTYALACLRVRPSLVKLPPTYYLNTALLYFEKFLNSADPDHRKVPEAYYCLGLGHHYHGKEMGLSLKEYYSVPLYYYNVGKDAEKNQLPCFLPYDSVSKYILEYILNQNSDNLDSNENYNLANSFLSKLMN